MNALPIGIARVPLLSGGTPAHKECTDLKRNQRRPIPRVGDCKRKNWRNKEIVKAGNCNQRNKGRLPDPINKGSDYDDKQINKPYRRERKLQPIGNKGHSRNGCAAKHALL
jgi:hypothetical protein